MSDLNRREFIRRTGLAAGGLYIASGPAGCQGIQRVRAAKKPNILFIFSDQQTAGAMSCMGNRQVSTPAMDSLAANGVLFENSYCTFPLCAPSRSSLITSRMPHETGVNYNDQTLKSEIPNMGDIFRLAGYRTIWAGKWHLPESYPLRGKSKQHEIPGFEVLKFYDSKKDYPEWGYGDTTDGPLGDAVADFINGYNDDKPFLLAVSFCNPHDICYYPRRPDRYPKPEEIGVLPPLPANFAVDANEPQLVQRRRELSYYGEEISYTKDWDENRWRGYIHEYYRMVERVDKQIGRVIKSLTDKGLDKDTLVIFTSDHGDGVAAHKWAAKLNLYQEAATVPLIVSWKGRTPRRIDRKHLVSGLDVLPTMCDYAGAGHSPNFRGRSVRPIIDNPRSAWCDFLVTELAPDPQETSHKARMIRTARYKYNLFSKGERNEQLFDLANDPGETQNLAYKPAMKQVKDRHKEMLAEWVKETGDDFDSVLNQQ